MKKFVLLLLLGVFLQAQEFLYEITVKGTLKAALSLKENNNQLDVEYFKVKQQDKIVFYAPTKSIQLEKLSTGIAAKKIKISGSINTIYYNMQDLTQNIKDMINIPDEQLSNYQLIVDNNAGVTTFDKIPVHTIETIIYSLYQNKKVLQQEFLLYEPHKDLMIKVHFEKADTQDIKIDKVSLTTDVYELIINGRNKKLIRIYMNPNPIKIEAASKYWSFTLKGTKATTYKINKATTYLSNYKTVLLKTYESTNVKVLKENKNINVLSTSYTRSKKITRDELKSAINDFLLTSPSIVRSLGENDFIFKASQADISSNLNNKFEMIDATHYKEKVVLPPFSTTPIKQAIFKDNRGCSINKALTKIQCKDELEDLNLEPYIKKFLASKKHIHYTDLQYDIKNEIINMNFYVKKSLTNEQLNYYRQSTILKNYPQYNLKILPLVKIKNSDYALIINKSALGNYLCHKTLNTEAIYKDNKCTLKTTIYHKKEVVDTYVLEQFKLQNPLIKILNLSPINNTNDFSITYLGDHTNVY